MSFGTAKIASTISRVLVGRAVRRSGRTGRSIAKRARTSLQGRSPLHLGWLRQDPKEEQTEETENSEPKPRPLLKGGYYSRDKALELLNSHFFIGRREQEPVEIYRINDDGSLTLYPQKAFHLEVGNIFVPGQEKPIQANTWWPKHRQRHQRRIVFKPHGTNDPNEYNIWRGFGVEPREGKEKSRSLIQHIFNVICRGNHAHFQYLVCWMAWKVQNPDKHPETIVVLKSKYQGTGKSLLGDVMSMIFGRLHALLVDHQEQIFGDFTEHLELGLLHSDGGDTVCRRSQDHRPSKVIHHRSRNFDPL